MAQHNRIITIRDDLTQDELIMLAAEGKLKVAQKYEANDNKKQYTAITNSVLFEDNIINIRNLEFDIDNNAFNKTNLDGTVETFELSKYLDDTNASRIVAGTLDGATGIATFNRDDSTEFTVDLSNFLKDLNYKTVVVDTLSSNGTLSIDDGDSETDPVVVDFKVLPNVTVDYVILKDLSGNDMNLKLTNNNGVLETVLA